MLTATDSVHLHVSPFGEKADEIKLIVLLMYVWGRRETRALDMGQARKERGCKNYRPGQGTQGMTEEVDQHGGD